MTVPVGQEHHGWSRPIDDDSGIRLRRPTLADASGVLSVHGDPRVYIHDPHEVQHDSADAERFLRPLLRHWSDHGFGYWTVLAPPQWWLNGSPSREGADNGRVFAGLGGIQHHSLADGEPVLNVYCRLAPSVQGRGVAATILREAIRLAVRLAPSRDIVIRTRPANATVCRVAGRAGFIDLGREPGVENMQLFRMAVPR